MQLPGAEVTEAYHNCVSSLRVLGAGRDTHGLGLQITEAVPT